MTKFKMVVMRHLIMQMMPLLGEWYALFGCMDQNILEELDSVQNKVKELTGDQAHPDSDYEVE